MPHQENIGVSLQDAIITLVLEENYPECRTEHGWERAGCMEEAHLEGPYSSLAEQDSTWQMRDKP